MSACGESRPLVTFGVLSAAPYAFRREHVRQTWRCYAAVRSGEALVPFVIGLNVPPGQELSDEQRVYDDLVLLQTGVAMTRAWSPLHTTYLWFRHAVRTSPYRESCYIGKLDDDAFINVQEVSAQLRLLLPRRRVYYGRFYYTAWQPHSFQCVGSGYTAGDVSSRARLCLTRQTCHGPYRFTTGTIQMLSHALATEVAESAAVAADVERSRALIGEGSERMVALEDAVRRAPTWLLAPSPSLATPTPTPALQAIVRRAPTPHPLPPPVAGLCDRQAVARTRETRQRRWQRRERRGRSQQQPQAGTDARVASRECGVRRLGLQNDQLQRDGALEDERRVERTASCDEEADARGLPLRAGEWLRVELVGSFDAMRWAAPRDVRVQAAERELRVRTGPLFVEHG